MQGIFSCLEDGPNSCLHFAHIIFLWPHTSKQEQIPVHMLLCRAYFVSWPQKRWCCPSRRCNTSSACLSPENRTWNLFRTVRRTSLVSNRIHLDQHHAACLKKITCRGFFLHCVCYQFLLFWGRALWCRSADQSQCSLCQRENPTHVWPCGPRQLLFFRKCSEDWRRKQLKGNSATTTPIHLQDDFFSVSRLFPLSKEGQIADIVWPNTSVFFLCRWSFCVRYRNRTRCWRRPTECVWDPHNTHLYMYASRFSCLS